MDVELIDHEDPPGGLGIGVDGLANMGCEVLIGAGLAYRGSDHVAARHLKVGYQALRAVAHVLMLLALEQSGAHRKGPMESLEGLNAALLVSREKMDALLVQGERLGVVLANHPNPRVEDLGIG